MEQQSERRMVVLRRGLDFGDGVGFIDGEGKRFALFNASARNVWQVLAAGGSASDGGRRLEALYGVDAAEGRSAVATFIASLDAWISTAIASEPPPRDISWEGPLVRTAVMVAERLLAVEGPEPVVAALVASLPTTPRLAPIDSFSVASMEPASIPCLRLEAHGSTVALHADGIAPVITNVEEEWVGGFFQALLALGHDITDWLAVIHGAAIALGGKSIVLAGTSGVGKTTLAAAMTERGYACLADDIVAVEAERQSVLPLPTALSVKPEGHAVVARAFRSLGPFRAVSRGRMAALGLLPNACWATAPAPVAALVFPTYVPGASLEVIELGRIEAAARLFADRVHLGPVLTPERVVRFMAWIDSMPRFALRYGDGEAAIDVLSRVLGRG